MSKPQEKKVEDKRKIALRAARPAAIGEQSIFDIPLKQVHKYHLEIGDIMPNSGTMIVVPA